MTNYVNLTPHAIVLNDGRVFEPSGIITRVSSSYTEIVNDVCERNLDGVINMPPVVEGTIYIVSGMVLSALNAQGERTDFVAPATDHPDVVRNDKGHIVSVPGFVK